VLSPNVLGSLLDVHIAWAWVLIISNGLAGIWSLSAHWVVGLRTRALVWFTVFSQVAVFIQVALGVGLIAGQKLSAPQFHLFYGFVAIIAVGILYSYRDAPWMQHRLYQWYGAGGLFVMGLGIRAMLVAQAGAH
jgi:hypothetical protein